MIGFITWTEEKAPRRADELMVLRARFLRMRILQTRKTPAALVRRRCARAAAQLQKLGISRAVFPAGFPYGAIFAKRGVLPVDVLPLYRALAGEWLRAALEARGRGGSTAAVCGEHLTGELSRTVTELCLRYRYVLLDVPSGGEELARQLRREYGVALQLRPGREQLEAADGVILFSPREALQGNVTVPLYDGASIPSGLLLTLPPVLEEKLPGGCQRDQLLAALMSAGAVRPAQIALSIPRGGSA